MGWVLAIGLAAVCFAVLLIVFRLPRQCWEATAAALLLGLAGYALQGNPAQPGAGKAPPEEVDAPDTAPGAAERKAGPRGPLGDPLLMTAAAFARHGKYADAADFARAAADKDAGNGDAWLALANYLVGHAEGNLTPAALYSYGQAEATSPGNPAPAYFLGLALAQAGQLEQGRAVWADLLARSPKEAPWREDLAAKLASLDAFIAAQRGQAPQ